MTLQRLQILLLCLLSACSISSAAADSGMISGTVRDVDGRPLPDVVLTLTGGSTRQASSDSSGRFRFASLPNGDYILSASRADYVPSNAQSIHVQSAPIDQDVVLSRVSAAAPQFQSSGIRGLIDPGGYSASTADASSGVLRDIAKVKRDGNAFAVPAEDWPCALEPQLQQTVARSPDHPESLLRLGQFYIAHNQPSLAIPLLQRALKLRAASEPISSSLAAALLAARNFDSARQVLARALAKHETPELHELLARTDEGSGLFRQAAEEYRRASDLSATEESSFGIGYELILSGSLAEAGVAFAQGISRYPKSILMQIGAGTAHFLQGDSAAAFSNFLAASEIDPADHRPYPFLAAVSSSSGDREEQSRAAFKRYLTLNPASADANYSYAAALARTESPDDAAAIEDLLKRAIQIDPALAKAHLLLADRYARRGDFADAVPQYEATIRLTPDAGPHYRLALAYKRLGRAADSAREMQLFRQSRGANDHSDTTPGIDLAQFLSVMDPAESSLSPAPPCPASPQ